MSLEQLKEIIESNKDNQEIQSYIKGLAMTPDGVQAYLESEEGKKILQPKLDQYFTKGLDSWKQKTLPTVLEEEINKRFPPESEEKKQLRELSQKLQQIESEKQRETLKNKAITQATQKQLPLELVDFLVSDTEESTQANLTLLEKVWNESLKKSVEEKFKENGRNPHGNGGNDYQGINPWKKDTFNLTMQAKIMKDDPELAQLLKSQAK